MYQRLIIIFLVILAIILPACSANGPSNSQKDKGTINGEGNEDIVVNIISDLPVTVDMFADEGSKTAVQISGKGSAAGQFYATTAFNALEASCPSWSNNIGSLTFSLYRWDGDYETSVRGKVIAEETFVDYNDNAWLKLEFAEQPRGRYLWVLSNGIETVGVWKSTVNMENILAYSDGQIVEGSYMTRVHYVNTPDVNFGKVSGGLDLTVVVKTPPVHEYPANHPINTHDTYSDTWVATDGLGRTLPGYSEVGEVRKDKFVGLFYWTWHYNFAKSVEPKNVTEIMAKYPEAKYDLKHPAWGPLSAPHFWNEPLFGYYDSTDRWVLRRHAEMLADAGVDVIFFDCTNGSFTWRPSYIELFEVFAEARSQGVKTPQVAFMLPFGPSDDALVSLKQLYLDIYRNKKYHELWFYWKGKPVIMAYPDKLNEKVKDANENKLRKEIKDFFTFRPGQPSYTKGDDRGNQWGWLSVYPQQLFGKKKSGAVEQVTVGVAQNHSAEKGLTAMNDLNVFGRSYTVQKGLDTRPDAKLYGANFSEQWEYALKVDPEFIFITGWNEWIAGRHEVWQGVTNAFPDQFDDEHSRDIEPTKGDLKDHYYYQMVSYIRRFKGVRPPLKASGSRKIDINSRKDQWSAVTPAFRHHIGSILHRDYDGWKGTHYINNTGRNDIVLSKVAYDKEYIYFMVETHADLSPKTDKAWMRLFIDTKASGNSHWEGYEFVINRINPDKKAVIEASTGGWNWNKVGEADYTINGNRLQLKVPRSVLGLNESEIDIKFKWSDNMQNDGDIMDFYQYGDTAPGGRFNYHYTAGK